jgi:hypothetical protein
MKLAKPSGKATRRLHYRRPVAGAALVEVTEQMARSTGLADIQLNPKPDYVNAMKNWESPLYRKIVEHLLAGTQPGDYITNLEVLARRPAS